MEKGKKNMTKGKIVGKKGDDKMRFWIMLSVT